MTQAERVILIQGDADKWFEQAIFIVKPTRTAAIPKNMVEEAEQIIAAYLTKNNKPLPAGLSGGVQGRNAARGYAPTTGAFATPARTAKKNARHGAGFFLNILMLVACLVLAGVFLYGMLG